jgi:hypothetical protein
MVFVLLDLVEQVTVEEELVKFDVVVSFEVPVKLFHKLDLVQFQ